MQLYTSVLPLVQVGAQNYPDLTIAFLQEVPREQLKSELMLGAADALMMRTRLPIRGNTSAQGRR